MRERGDIFLADLLKVVDELKPDRKAAEIIFRILNLDHLKRAADRSTPGGYDSSQQPARNPVPGGGVAGLTPDELGAEVEPQGPPLELSIRRIGSTSGATDPPWRGRSVVPISPAPSVAAPALEPEPIFEALRQRAILSAGLATQVPEGALDLRKILERLVRLEPLDRLPRLPVPTLRRGVQLLLDYSPAMLPYAADRRQLRVAIEHLLGSSCSSLFFRGSPGRGVLPVVRDRRRKQFEEWLPPSRGTVVALVSDLGIGGPPASAERSSRSEWISFVRRARAYGNPIVAFVPFPPSRWDRALTEYMTLIHWDRHTTVRSVRRAVGSEHRGAS